MVCGAEPVGGGPGDGECRACRRDRDHSTGRDGSLERADVPELDSPEQADLVDSGTLRRGRRAGRPQCCEQQCCLTQVGLAAVSPVPTVCSCCGRLKLGDERKRIGRSVGGVGLFPSQQLSAAAAARAQRLGVLARSGAGAAVPRSLY
jgi:hypothetical protein